MTEPKDPKKKTNKRPRPAAPRQTGARRAPSSTELKTKRTPRDRAAHPPRTEPTEESRELALLIAQAALEKKAAALEILDVTGKVDYADFLVLMTGRSNRHVDTLAHEIEAACERKKKRALSVEGLPTAVWVLLDFGDVVVHVFQEQTRGLYDIEGLWLDAKRLPVPGGTAS